MQHAKCKSRAAGTLAFALGADRFRNACSTRSAYAPQLTRERTAAPVVTPTGAQRRGLPVHQNARFLAALGMTWTPFARQVGAYRFNCVTPNSNSPPVRTPSYFQ